MSFKIGAPPKKVSKLKTLTDHKLYILLSLMTLNSLYAAPPGQACLQSISFILDKMHSESADITHAFKLQPVVKELNIAYIERNLPLIKSSLRELEKEVNNTIYVHNALKENLKKNPQHALALLNILKRKKLVNEANQIDTDKVERLFELKRVITVLKKESIEFHPKKIGFYPDVIKLKMKYKASGKQLFETDAFEIEIKPLKTPTVSFHFNNKHSEEISITKDEINLLLREVENYQGETSLELSARDISFESVGLISNLLKRTKDEQSEFLSFSRYAFEGIDSRPAKFVSDYWDKNDLVSEFAEASSLFFTTSDKLSLLKKLETLELKINELFRLADQYKTVQTKSKDHGKYYYQFLRLRDLLSDDGTVDQTAINNFVKMKAEIATMKNEMATISFSKRNPLTRDAEFKLGFTNYDRDEKNLLHFAIRYDNTAYHVEINGGRGFVVNDNDAAELLSLLHGHSELIKDQGDNGTDLVETELSKIPFALFEKITVLIQPFMPYRIDHLKASYLLERTYPEYLMVTGVQKHEVTKNSKEIVHTKKGIFAKLHHLLTDNSLDLDFDDYTLQVMFKKQLTDKSEDQIIDFAIHNSFTKTYVVVNSKKKVLPRALRDELTTTLLQHSKVKDDNVKISITDLSPELVEFLSAMGPTHIEQSFEKAMPYYMITRSGRQ